MSSEDCFYFTVGDQALTWFHFFPTGVFFGLWIASLRPDGTRQGALFFYSLYLTMWNLALWALQIHFSILRPNVICGHLYTYAFPSIEAFLFGNLVAAFFTYCYWMQIHISWKNWVIMYGMIVAPQAFMVIVGYNRVWEVLVSFSLGVVSSVFYVSVLWLYIRPLIPYIETQAPFTWLHLKDTYFLKDSGLKESREIKSNVDHCTKCIKQIQRTRGTTESDTLVGAHGSRRRT